MLEGRVTDLTKEERLDYFRRDEWAPKIIHEVLSFNPSARIFAVDTCRELREDYMLYIIFGVDQDTLDNLGRKLLPSYSAGVGAACIEDPFLLATRSKQVVMWDYFDITELGE